MSGTIFTIGHSNLEIETFLAMLEQHKVTAIADVRSSPYSRFCTQFNREDLRKSLAARGIRYVFLGAELGARSDDPDCYIAGKVQYDRLAESPAFALGVARVIEGAKSHRIAMMCAEKEPLDCHRTILVSRELVERGIDVRHILSNGVSEAHRESLSRLLEVLGLPEGDMFKSRDRFVEDAYRIQGERIAYDKNAGWAEDKSERQE